ncbi:30S ribosomal protein S9 [Candidatus Woesebacteria bacterium RIFOXYC1_FULL_31_51]|uniref:30S ribosomal protein S9 n=1 Tax=Candidatus Woesebacteria bacterium GW2011_GWC2_31_9 TaxID=1618586 RepID=A0A0G0B009_9BACT|nr:MAG: 30S ribosomal protein S9, small subunit ribosomal protein S9 [Candidatus Woesebacteria bacterium GW2011_GWF1_31_35]KKP23342.1 MAG: Ribosomal protein S9 [Candidatus Woesebacteria bacterium GW2011_GWC1_30_29]KKP26140.1 MAG: Ribosomal protein S9 [Candidatus Woesebacteria bacterium GW2011_GWD1_31_12]KKP27603.1 MAG: Ribosomal protein S9 [Candidatus Woesebacteria bacterium GW2011_GWB1_31_29]KKP30841.1 MAG: Ribosomal protein S9 [Candidatus Woesebacteria bacterium GW2011_GWE2_31_6]KKP32120.1 M
MKKISSKKTYTFTVGRRKSSSARVRLFKGTGESLINGQKVSSIYQNKVSELSLNKPFKVTDTLGKFYFTANVAGGGKEGQLEAIVHGISRALVKLDSEKYRISLKTNNLLTRDSRVRLRRMVGTGGKARRKKQSPKR